MSMIAEVVKVTGATHADVLRVATHGGTTDADRRIAHAIEAAGGRRASDLMDMGWRAEHTRLQDALWLQTREEDLDFLRLHAARAGIDDIEPLLPAVSETPSATPTNAVYDPEVTVYAEDTDGALTEASEQADADVEDVEDATGAEQAAEEMAAAVYADLAQLLNDADAATTITRDWTHPVQGRRALMAVVLSTPRLRRAARRYAQRPALTA